MGGLRIAVIAQPNRGGMWIAPQAEELRRRGHDVLVMLPPSAGPGELTNALTGRRFPVIEAPLPDRLPPTPATLRRLWRLRRLIREHRVDVLYYHPYAAALATRLATLGIPVRRVHRVDGALHLDSALSRRIERLLWRMDDTTICCTEHVSGRYGGLGCPSARRPVAYGGTDLARFRPSWAPRDRYAGSPARAEARAKARAEIGVDEHLFLAVMVGYVYPPARSIHRGRSIKGHDVLLEAWARFHVRHPRSHLLIVGGGVTGAGEAHRAELIERFRIADDPSVTWLDSVPDVRPYYRAADVSVTPARAAGSSAPLREASAMSVPSIVSDADGLAEGLDGTDGWVVPRGDVGALAEALGAAFREFEGDRLATRGDHARRRAVRLFEHRVAAMRVADIIERTANEVGAR